MIQDEMLAATRSRWIRAYLAGDIDVLDEIEVSEFSVLSGHGAQAKAEQLAAIARSVRAGQWITAGSRIDEVLFGVATVGEFCQVHGVAQTIGGENALPRCMFSETWRRGAKGWQLAHLHVSHVDGPAGARALMPFPELATSRLRLREIVDSDATDLLAIHSDAQHMRLWGRDPLKSEDEALERIEKFRRARHALVPAFRWGIELKDGGNLLGTCGLFDLHPDWQNCLTGYELAAHACGRGLMREALAAVFEWGIRDMGLQRIGALVHQDNAASLKLLRGLGFQQEGKLRSIASWGGRRHDLLQLSLLAAGA